MSSTVGYLWLHTWSLSCRDFGLTGPQTQIVMHNVATNMAIWNRFIFGFFCLPCQIKLHYTKLIQVKYICKLMKLEFLKILTNSIITFKIRYRCLKYFLQYFFTYIILLTIILGIDWMNFYVVTKVIVHYIKWQIN